MAGKITQKASLPRKARLIRQFEVTMGCFLAAAGYLLCDRWHFCYCGHLAHGNHLSIKPWLIDGAWLFGLLMAGVVGLRGGFTGARVTSVFCLLVALVSGGTGMAGALGPIVALPLVLAGFFHLVSLTEFFFRARPNASAECNPLA